MLMKRVNRKQKLWSNIICAHTSASTIGQTLGGHKFRRDNGEVDLASSLAQFAMNWRANNINSH